MSDHVEQRVGELEQTVSRLDATMVSVQRDVGELRQSNNQILSVLQSIEKQNAARPEGLTWKTIMGTLGSVLAGAALIWQIVAMSPAVATLEKRLDRIEPVVKRNDDALLWRPTAWTAEVRRSP